MDREQALRELRRRSLVAEAARTPAERIAWLEEARRLDLAVRGQRRATAPGLDETPELWRAIRASLPR